MNAQFKVYDTVWVMRNDQPTSLIVFRVTEEMNYAKTGTELKYFLVESQVGASESNAVGRYAKDMYHSKKALIESL